MQVNHIRQKFLEYFRLKNHTVVKSGSLVPNNDPTLLFTNAGMNQFKDVFLGVDKRGYTRAASAQKCVRAGGKHNDLENVGYTARHHTFFEMLGNFSFGDYFKEDAIKYAWEFLTDRNLGLGITKDKLYVTVYHTDEEAYDIWKNIIGLEEERIIRIGDKVSGGSDNFWQMGDTGPCGPCTEIFYDHGKLVPGGLPGSSNADGDRYIEIWNCVFMQYNRDEKGILHALPKPSVDTGMGLERISAVMQGVRSNYEIDIFANLIDNIAKLIGLHKLTKAEKLNNPSLKIIADHIRAVSFLIADGVVPSPEGRGYVLRRIMRRAIRHGYKLGLNRPFLHKAVNELAEQMGKAYPELIDYQSVIERTILQEEEKFFQTIDHGMHMLQDELSQLKERALPGEVAFKLYDTYGFPLDLTQDVCRELKVSVDVRGFDLAMEKQKDQAKSGSKFKMDAVLEYEGNNTVFIGYEENGIEAQVIAIYVDNKLANSLAAGQIGIVVLDKTVFYAESGGQIGDSGIIESDGGLKTLFIVDDSQRIHPQVVGHVGHLSLGTLKIGDNVTVTYDLHKRLATMRNHSATHLLHKALHEVLGAHATQKGSLVTHEYTRFDFAHDKPLSRREIAEIERIVNHVIMMNYGVNYVTMSYEEAIKQGAMALFGEKYTDNVRVITMGGFSTELCGGTHVKRTGDIGLFSIISESGVANGIRRIEAVTGEAALHRLQHSTELLTDLRQDLKAQSNEIIRDKVASLISENRGLAREIEQLKAKLATNQADDLLSKAVTLNNGIKSLVSEMANTDTKTLLELVDKLKAKLKEGIIVIGSNNRGKVHLIVGVTPNLTSKYKAGVIVNHLAGMVGGKGGGRPDLAQAGGADADKLESALAAANTFIESL
jgi:alanyl-tRNA synthetase